MKHLVIFFGIFFISINLHASEDWGKKGHRTVGEIAEIHLTKKARRAIGKLLNGESLALVSTYGDEIKSDTAFRKYGPWHYVDFPMDATYDEAHKNEKGDLIKGIETCVTILKDRTASEEDKVFYLKMLVHFIGDLHQPLHVGLEEDKGGNDFQVRWFNEGTNLHTVWDTTLIEYYGMSYTELAENRKKLSEQQLQNIESGTVKDWMEDSRVLFKDVYANTEKGEKLGYEYAYKYMDTVRLQLQKGGIRLAKVLNDIFG